MTKLKTIRGVYDFSKQGGAVSAITLTGVAVPQGTSIARVFFNPITTLTSGGSATIALAIGGVAVKAATAFDNAAYTTKNLLYSTGSPTTSAAAATVTIATAAITAGKFEIVIEYFN
jgi:hypothetical protein